MFGWFSGREREDSLLARLLTPCRAGLAGAKLSAEGLSHSYPNHGAVVALAGVTLHVRPGEFVCLLGPSGCGKSTLLYALAGHLVPSAGTVRLDGAPVVGPGPQRLLLFQEPALFPWMSVEKNITFALAAQGVSAAERTERARRFIAQVGLGGFERSLPHQLSGGMKMRASLARALALDPPVLLMDEPFGSLDAQTRHSMHELLQAIWLRQRKTVVFVTHDVQEALVLSTRLVVMAPRPGRVLRDVELNLPLPRQPDDPSVVAVARHVRSLLREVGQAEPGDERAREEVHHAAVRTLRGDGGRGPPPAAPLGARL